MKTSNGQAVTTRYGSSLGGDLGVQITGQDVSLTLVDPHGDVAATIDLPASGDPEGIKSFSTWDEWGNPLTTTPNTGALTYGWLGGKERATDTSGLILMGARLYNTVTTLFTSTDPVAGGNTTTYAYPQDPANQSDITGECVFAVVDTLVCIGVGEALFAGAVAIAGGVAVHQILKNPPKLPSMHTTYAHMKKGPVGSRNRKPHKNGARQSTKKKHEDAGRHGGVPKWNNTNKRGNQKQSKKSGKRTNKSKRSRR
jgi:RHS repeat-associated protein